MSGGYRTSMLDRIRQMFSKPKLSDEARDFITKLATSDIWILAVGLRARRRFRALPTLQRSTSSLLTGLMCQRLAMTIQCFPSTTSEMAGRHCPSSVPTSVPGILLLPVAFPPTSQFFSPTFAGWICGHIRERDV